MRPRLKNVALERSGAALRLAYDRRDHLLVEDPDGSVERLLRLLTGDSTVSELARLVDLPERAVDDAVRSFDAWGLLEDADRTGTMDAARLERHASNLAFFESFASLRHSREDFQRRLDGSHVLVLGTGGVNSTVLQHLCGLGVGRVTLLDRDAVEARNFARQYLYRWADIGARKVDRAAAWVNRFDPAVDVVAALDTDLTGTGQLTDLLDRYRPDVVASGVDQPRDIDDWLNAACVSRGVPYVRAGMAVTQGVVWSVEPGRSPCRACPGGAGPDAADAADAAAETDDADVELDVELEESRAGLRLFATKERVNPGVGPAMGLLGSLAAFEVLRYLTGFEPPAYAGAPVVVDFAAGCATERHPWVRRLDCDVCGTPSRRPATASTGGR